jgi:hypothetical protein
MPAGRLAVVLAAGTAKVLAPPRESDPYGLGHDPALTRNHVTHPSARDWCPQ